MGQVLWFYCETWLMCLAAGTVLVGLSYVFEKVITKLLDKRK